MSTRLPSLLKWSISLLLLAVLLIWYATPLADRPPSLISRAELFGPPARVNPKLSPDGKQLAFLAPDNKGVLNVWIAPVEDLSKATQATKQKKRGVQNYLWQGEGQNILFLQDSDGDENWHLYQFDLQTLVTRDLTPFTGSRAQIVAYERDKPDQMLVGLNLRDKAHFDVFRLNLHTGALEHDTENRQNFLRFVADHSLRVCIAERYSKNGGQEILVRDDSASPWRPLISWEAEDGMGAAAAFAPDNETLYILSGLGNETTRLLGVNIRTGQRIALADDPQYDLEGIITHPRTHELLAVAVDREKPDYFSMDPEFDQDLTFIQKTIGPHFDIVSRTHDNQRWIVCLCSDIKPVEYYLYDRYRQQTTKLFTSRPELEKHHLSPMKPISFKARDGMVIYGYLTLPSGLTAKNLPAILLVHGGPWLRDSWGLDLEAQWLANRGYAVLQVNYRGSLGYGKTYLNAGNKEWGAKMQEDLLDAKNWLVEQEYANPHKVGIYGASYGGYATLAGLAFTPEQFCCGIDVVGISNLVTYLQTVPPYWNPAKSLLDQRVGHLQNEEQLLKERSPLFQAHRIQRPLLIAQGANDPRVKQAESDQIVQAMRENNLPVEYLVFPDEGHGFVRPENRRKFYAAAERFLAQHLGGREEPPGELEDWNEHRR